MKKLLLLLIALIFLTVSCSSSKKAEADADILPDEDAVDEEDDDADLDDEDETDYEEPDEDEDETEDTDPCEPNPCENLANSDGICNRKENEGFECGCIEGYFWDSNKCLNPCENINCGKFEHSSGECKAVNESLYGCGCEEGYWWWGEEKGCLDNRPYLGKICTGQTKCYNMEKEIKCPTEGEDFFGQDAQYAALGYCLPQSFTIRDSDKGEKTVFDNNTGLEWQSSFFQLTTEDCDPVFAQTCNEAVEYCKNLNYAGHDDWRLPTILELLSIAESDKTDPAINMDYFPDTPSEYFVTSSSSIQIYSYYVDDEIYPHYGLSEDSFSWKVDFFNGDSPYLWRGKNFYVRCVRGTTLSDSKANVYAGDNIENPQFTFNSNDNLIWQRGTKNSYNWQEALKYCENLNFAGLSNWRLPNKNELVNSFPTCYIYPDYQAGDLLDPQNSHYIDSHYVWTSTTLAGDSTKAWLGSDEFCAGNPILIVPAYKTISKKHFKTRCVTENPCEKGRFWNGEKCVKNPCDGNPCESEDKLNRICKVLDENNYICGCSSCLNNNDEHGDGKCYKSLDFHISCGCEEGYRQFGGECVKE